MEQPFSWQIFDKMARTLEGVGYIVITVGPIVGLVMLITGGGVGRATGVAIILGSFLISLYHFAFSLLMAAMHHLLRQLQDGQSADHSKTA